MEEDLRGYLDWITQAEDLDAEPTSNTGGGSTGRHGGDNGTGKLLERHFSMIHGGGGQQNHQPQSQNVQSSDLKPTGVLAGLLKTSMVPMQQVVSEGELSI